MARTYRERRDLACDLLGKAGLCRYRPEGAFYLLVDLPEPDTDTFAYARRLLQQADVAVAPGETFGAGGSGRLRISLAAALPELREGLERLIRYAAVNAENRS